MNHSDTPVHTAPQVSSSLSPSAMIVGGGLWLLAVAAASAAGVFEGIARASAPAYGGVIALSITIALMLYLGNARTGRAVDTVSTRALTLFHVPRILGGVIFLAYGASGVLSPVLATRVGYGDIVAGVAALSILFVRAPRREWLATIHLIGLADLAIGLATGMILGLQGDTLLIPIAQLPLTLILLFWVPLLVVSHVATLRRLWRGKAAAPAVRALHKEQA